MPKRVTINEEGPREGFQIESAAIQTARKIELIEALSETGLKHLQVVSFVNPKRIVIAPASTSMDTVKES